MERREATAVNEAARERRRAWREEADAARVALKVRLGEESGLTDHPKFDMLFEMAWDHGHSAGLYEVEYYFVDFARLLKD